MRSPIRTVLGIPRPESGVRRGQRAERRCRSDSGGLLAAGREPPEELCAKQGRYADEQSEIEQKVRELEMERTACFSFLLRS